jgi:hypothetical protein
MDLKSFLSNTEAALSSLVGGDGKVSPLDYRKALLVWTEKGLPAAEFHNTYGKFRNESHNQDYFKTSTVTQSGGPSTRAKDLRF